MEEIIPMVADPDLPLVVDRIVGMWTSVDKRVMSHVLERTKREFSPGETVVLSALLAGATPTER